tara:strand:- start:5155 stop:5310 length:156 start_codon:yes stop_codon:yes gene_type:complete
MTFDLIYPAIFVFLLMIIGVVLTAIEFNQLEEEERQDKDRSESSNKNHQQR